DLLDFGVGAEQLDKRTFSDVKNGLLTLPLILFLNGAGAEERARALSLLADAHMEENQLTLRSLLESRGAFDSARDMAVAHVRSGRSFLASLPESEATSHLRQLCLLMADRAV